MTYSQATDVFCVQECSGAWQEIIFIKLGRKTECWHMRAGANLVIAWNTDSFADVVSSVRLVFTDPRDTASEKRRFRKFLEVCLCLM